ncbi:unnamed protein product [Nezara viridula]|uniref:Uncharacterized protein n=1 Tax=Nezara viridula TaxID=85310 RepID=A0A9P0HEE4_NEZVI|nr:unnamed protein product [Nezara viridula]
MPSTSCAGGLSVCHRLKEDAHFFKIRPLNSTHVSLRLSQSLENLVDNPVPQNVLKFRLACDSDEHDETVS